MEGVYAQSNGGCKRNGMVCGSFWPGSGLTGYWGNHNCRYLRGPYYVSSQFSSPVGYNVSVVIKSGRRSLVTRAVEESSTSPAGEQSIPGSGGANTLQPENFHLPLLALILTGQQTRGADRPEGG
ncbi:hypothetical protein LEMLEM_LOCUS12752 [Lemmus lemmus]